MNYTGVVFLDSEEFMPCAPMFVETSDGFALTDAARAVLAAMPDLEPVDPDPALDRAPVSGPSVAERLVRVRADLQALAADLPAAAPVMEPYDLLDAVQVLQESANLVGSCDQAVVAELDRQQVHETAGAVSTAMLLADHLRIRPADAKRRVQRA